MNDLKTIIFHFLKEHRKDFSEDMLTKFCNYANLLVLWNKKMNLTSILEPKEIAIKHFIDSVSVLDYVDIPQNARIIDVGTGAGFPGVPLKIVRPDIDLTLMDSLNKRLAFLDNVLTSLNLEADLVHARAEEFAHKEIYREKYDFVFSRAVARLNVLSELCIPYVKKNGVFVAMKSVKIDDEIQNSLNAIKILGGNLEEIKTFNLIDGSERSIVKIRKIKDTPSIYPRQNAKISKKPL